LGRIGSPPEVEKGREIGETGRSLFHSTDKQIADATEKPSPREKAKGKIFAIETQESHQAEGEEMENGKNGGGPSRREPPPCFPTNASGKDDNEERRRGNGQAAGKNQAQEEAKKKEKAWSSRPKSSDNGTATHVLSKRTGAGEKSGPAILQGMMVRTGEKSPGE